ncbi:alpha/beta fold hydrolase [Plastoroseomonas arctica]|uniref:Alpha/beta hydrolase n=1 Tax=Plastoroseomonas arctica TaxID=1509237 RepID=A0AAF1K5Y8_9PROT|nr:alpha/beta hydrolase [Plastoroseomonas arctica]MBR0657095.1 alpha/beta hydrolase [Plastoroseomonas arctica]
MGAVETLLNTARRVETPCGAGTMVWHVWGEGTPLVLLHGGVGSWRHWLRVIPAFSGERQVIVPDLPGFSESAVPPSTAIEDVAAVVADGLRTITMAPVDLVGFSFGATVASHLVLHLGAQARSLTLVGAGGLVPLRAPMILEKVRGLEGTALREAHRENLARMMISDRAKIDDLALDIQEWNSSRARLDTRVYVKEGALRRALAEVTVPVDAVWGTLDQLAYWGLEDRLDALRALHPHARITLIPDAGHWLPYEAPEALIDILRGYFENRRVPEGAP